MAGTQLGQERCLEHRGFNWMFLAVFMIRNNGKKAIVLTFLVTVAFCVRRNGELGDVSL